MILCGSTTTRMLERTRAGAGTPPPGGKKAEGG